jgi:hypothetical protein
MTANYARSALNVLGLEAMGRPAVVAGIGAIGFSVLTIVGLGLMNPPGGNYAAHDIEKYLRHGHRVAVFAGLYVEILAALGLLLLLAYLRDRVAAPATRFASWVVGVIGASMILLGFTVAASGALARAYGGSAVVVPPTTSYVISEIGAAMIWGPGGVLLGVALILLAAAKGVALPAWLRWVTFVAGVLGLASPAFFPSFALLIWGLVTGLWLLVTGARAQAAPVGT